MPGFLRGKLAMLSINLRHSVCKWVRTENPNEEEVWTIVKEDMRTGFINMPQEEEVCLLETHPVG